VVLGDALSCEMDDMDWHMVSDDWGTDPVAATANPASRWGARHGPQTAQDGREVDLVHCSMV
jgi:hypothetical protein